MKTNWFDMQIYKLFYWRWNDKFREDSGLRQLFLDNFKVWEDVNPVDLDTKANYFAVMWFRTSHQKTRENLAKLFAKAMWEVRNADPRCKE